MPDKNPESTIPNRAEEKASPFAAPAISLPKGGGAIRGIGEKFSANPVTGTGSMSVPIATSPGRSGFGPQLSLSYDSGAGNGPFGFGWHLSLPSITRKTDKGLPRYDDAHESDVFILSGSEDLVPVLVEEDGKWSPKPLPHTLNDVAYQVQSYRPRIEGLFARIERWSNPQDPTDTFWRSISKDNITTWYGKTAESRIADPAVPSRIFSWLICQSYDDKGNAIVYVYQSEDSQRIFEDQEGNNVAFANERNRNDTTRQTNRYLKRIQYGNRTPTRDAANWQAIDPTRLPSDTWMFEVVFDYGEGHYTEEAPDADGRIFAQAQIDPPAGSHWLVRPDPFSTYRAGFEVRAYRLCRRVLMFHHFPQELEIADCLVRTTEFSYSSTPIASFISSVSQSGYVRQPTLDQPNRYLKKSLPPLEFTYSEVPDAAKLAQQPIEQADADSLENLPYGLDASHYQWVDLDGEGISGILTEQAGAWFYKRNLSPLTPHAQNEGDQIKACFAPVEVVRILPNASLADGAQFMDLAGDGQPDLVTFEGTTAGFYEHDEESGWNPFHAFRSRPAINTRDANLKFVDLDGDGHSDILITEGETLTWYSSLAEDGFGPANRVRLPMDEERGPRQVFADGTESIFLADLSGDGLSDFVRIWNGEVCYWPNLGYGHFGAKVTMDHSPWFDASDQFDPKRIRLADTDGSGTTDILYLHRRGVRIYLNQSGNGWSDAIPLPQFPPMDNLASVQALDLLGNGTACLVWSSPLPGKGRRAMRYIDLMGRQKPHLLISVKNNLGAETVVSYASSTKFYLADKYQGKPWVTRLPFPVHVVERVETNDCISGNQFVTQYAYHHGYFDGPEREFRGFGMVEQFDTDEFEKLDPNATNVHLNWHVPPIHTKTWFHTGAFADNSRISQQMAHEYFGAPQDKNALDGWIKTDLLGDSVLPDATLSADETREAYRALKGMVLRQEVYADDGLPKADIPYSVAEHNYTVLSVQPQTGNRFAVFFTHPRETITYHFERNVEDPRVQHELVLEVDSYGNVLKSVAIGYGRKQSDLDDSDKAKQTTRLLTYTENAVTNDIADQPDDYRTPSVWETRTYELTGYQPTNPPRFLVDDFVKYQDNKLVLDFHDEIYYEVAASTERQRRLIEHVRTLFRSDDLTALLSCGKVGSLALPGETLKLAFTPGLLSNIYKRKVNGVDENLLSNGAPALGGKSQHEVLEGKGQDEGGFLSSQTLRSQNLFPANDSDPNWTKSEDDDNWWIPLGRVFYAPGTTGDELAFAHAHFFLPHRFRDPFGNETTLGYDSNDAVPARNHNLLVVETKDALGNIVTVNTLDDGGNPEIRNDYRVLQPYWVTDPNGNRTRVAFDALGLVVATAVMGKPNAQPPAKGDTLGNLETNPTLAAIQNFVRDPLGAARGLLTTATTRIIYDLDRYQRCQEPPFAATLSREIHATDQGGDNSPIQIQIVYSDGFDRELQTKVQAEAGIAPARSADVELSSGDVQPGSLLRDGNNQIVRQPTNLRWVGTGRTVYNNKGKPVKKYEPFFSSTHLYEPEPDMTDTGVSPILFYDPLERVIVTLHPNDTYEKVVFDPWQQTTFDVNDTVAPSEADALHHKETGDPRTDSDIGGFVEAYFATQPDTWQTWYQQRVNGQQGEAEKDAAQKAAQHTNTPTVAHFDVLGRTFLTIADNGKDSNGNPQLYPTRIEFDIEGNQRAVRDAVVQDSNPLGRIVMTYDYDMLSHRVKQASMEAGTRWTVTDVMEKPIRQWDSRKFIRRMTYDELRRPTGLFVTENGSERQAEATIYGEEQGDANNLRTRVYQVLDGAGRVTNEIYDFKGNLSRSTRELLPDYKNEVDWQQNPDPNDGTFITTTAYDALNRPTALTTPDNSVYRPTYNEANLLDKVDVNLRGAADVTHFVTNINYNAKGQRVLIAYGNGAATTYEYDKNTFRLIHLKTTRTPGQNGVGSQIFQNPSTVQDLSYTYDPVGNITRIEDAALPAVTFANQTVAPVCDYIYDAIYRLTRASGREHIGQTAFNVDQSKSNLRDSPYGGFAASPNDLQALRKYTETYDYDEVGNFKSVQHSAGDGSWTRSYEYQEVSLLEPTQKSNRLTRTQIGNGTNFTENYTYLDAQGNDVHGCMTSINSMKMVWDFKDQLHSTTRQCVNDAHPPDKVPETTYYVYDASGQRVRKVTETQTGARKNERIYIGGYEVYREYSGGGVKLERETLHVMDSPSRTEGGNEQRIALVETKTIDNGSAINAPAPVQRYQLNNHLGSASVELDVNGALISYEEYHPYGTTAFQVMNSSEVSLKRYRYTGKERDEESGLNYHSARSYAPWLGRWTSYDPVGIVESPNLYLYSRDNPSSRIDANGRLSNSALDPLVNKASMGGSTSVPSMAPGPSNGPFTGSSLEQAKQSMRHVRQYGKLDPVLTDLPMPLHDLIGTSNIVPPNVLRAYLNRRGIAEKDIGGSLSNPITKDYFLIHDTSILVPGAKFPENINESSWGRNNLATLGAGKGVHAYVNRLGQSKTVTDFQTDQGMATQYEIHHHQRIFLNVELVQPRLRDSKGIDAIAPTPGFTNDQYDRLALLYIAASTRRGSWLVPGFHGVVDYGVGTHDDPQNFDLKLWTSRLQSVFQDIYGVDKGDFPVKKSESPTSTSL